VIPNSRMRRGLTAMSLVSLAACTARQVRLNPHLPAETLEPPRTESPSDSIGAGDLEIVQGTTAADAVRQLRPEFLRVRGRQTAATLASVYVNAQYVGEPEVLSSILLTEVRGIRYLSAMTAKASFGSSCRCEGGVILVRTQR
jgi:hypothetical protein